MKTTFIRSAALAIAALSSAAALSATTIMFEGPFNTIYTGPIVRSGFELGNVAGDEQHFHEIDAFAYSLANSGSSGVFLVDRDTKAYVEQVGGGAFSLTSVEVGSSYGSSMNISGYLLGNLVGNINVASLSTSTLALILGGSLSNVDLLVFDGLGGDGGFVLDNLTLGSASASVPDGGATIALFGMAMIGFGAFRRKFAA